MLLENRLLKKGMVASFPAFPCRALHRVRLFVSGLQVTSPCWLSAGLRWLDFAHVPVVHDSHMTIVPSDRDRIPTRFGDSAPVSSNTLPANASALLEILRFGGGHVVTPFAWVAHIVGQTAWRCLSHFPIKYSCEILWRRT
jgi:hypothetical protein